MSGQDVKKSKARTAAYNRVVERVKEKLSELERVSWEVIKQEIDEAIELEHGLAELTRDELDLLKAWVRRDLKSLVSFVQKGKGEFAEWLKIDLELVEARIRDALMSIADKTTVEMVELEHKIRHEPGVYVEGELASPGMLQCTGCGHMVCLTETTSLEPCHHCKGKYFRRVTARWPHDPNDP